MICSHRRFRQVMAFLNNVLEIRVDAVHMCFNAQRPRWQACQDIGSWFNVLNVLGFIAVVTNASMVTFVGLQVGTRPIVAFKKRRLNMFRTLA